MSDRPDLAGRRALITGASGGLGTALARTFAAAGAETVLADRERDAVAALAEELGEPASWHEFDQADLGSVAALAEAAGPLDVLVNNAAVLHVAPFLETEPATIQRLIATNLVGPLALARHVGEAMADRGRGVILNIGSQLAFCGAEHRSVYAAAKAGLVQFTRTAGVELGRQGVRVVCLAPGRLLTPMTEYLRSDPEAYEEGLRRVPVHRYGTPEEMARLALFLASDAAGYVVGETLIADGGYVHG